MNEAKFKAAYTESRNGASHFVRHPLVRQFQYSDGVQECAEAGCYWLLDIVATECLMPLRKSGEPMGIVRLTVGEDSTASIDLTVADDAPPIWHKRIPWTDMPPGEYVFELADEGDRFAFILITEH